MTDPNALSRPIGWWLKQADSRLNAAFDHSLADRQVDRRGWQVLASLAKRPTPRDQLVASLTVFEPPDAIEAVLTGLSSQGWIEDSDELLRLTAEGEREHAALAPLVDSVRGLIAAALPRDDYITLVRLLERLAAGL